VADFVGSRSPVVTLVGDLSFCPGLGSALELIGLPVRRSPTASDAVSETANSLFVLDGDREVRSGLDGARALHARTTGPRSPVLLLMRSPEIAEAVLAYRGGPLDAVEAGVTPAVLAFRLRLLAPFADAPESDSASLVTALLEAPDGIVVLSPSGDVEFANRAFRALLGAPDNAAAAVVLRGLRTPAGDRRLFLEVVPHDGTAWHGDLAREADPPLDVTFAATARRVVDARGTRSLLVILRDVTRVRLLEQRLADAQRMDAVGQLAGGVAHDFNNILSVITTLSDLLMRLRPADDPDREDLQEIFDSAQRGSEIARQLSAFSRPGLGEPEALDLNTVVERNEKMMRRLLGERIDLSLHLEPDAGNVRVDPVHLDQLILNLGLNARDAMSQGGTVRIATGRRALTQPLDTATGVVSPGRYVELKVTDSGQGMEESVRQRLFEPFFTTRGWGRHSGLGLSVVYGTVQGAGGGIEVESAPEVGTTIRILLPALEPALGAAAGRAIRGGPDDSTSVGSGETILLVEDDDVVRHGLERALQAAGYRVVAASDGADAVELLRTGRVRPHLVLSDVVMPSMNGTDLEAQIREIGLSAPVVFMSGYPEHPEVDRLRRSGVQVLAKPLEPGRLTRLLRLRLNEAAAIQLSGGDPSVG
jgi:signal transduction histidine kinase/ActR/RegA family two-component response regulator